MFSEDYDTSEKCRAPAWTDRVLWRRRVQQLDADNPNWNPGKLLFYGRAELKQSDHRPVVAILDIEYSLIDIDKRARVFNDVIMDLGPPDATVVIQTIDQHNDDDEDSIYDENVTAALVQELAEIGEVTLVRFVGETMWVTFKDGQAALAAVKHKANIQVCGINLSIKLKTTDWVKHVEKEISLCTTNCVQLCDYVDVSANADYNSLGIPLAPSEQAKKKPPARPALPKSPQATPKHQPRHLVSSNLLIKLELIKSNFLTFQAGVLNMNDLIRSSQPQPQLPERPCLPPRPKAMEPRPEQMSPPEQKSPQQIETYQAPSAIYEEIQEDIVSFSSFLQCQDCV